MLDISFTQIVYIGYTQTKFKVLDVLFISCPSLPLTTYSIYKFSEKTFRNLRGLKTKFKK